LMLFNYSIPLDVSLENNYIPMFIATHLSL